jgi:hypothetical protein
VENDCEVNSNHFDPESFSSAQEKKDFRRFSSALLCLPSAPGSILLSKHLTFLSPSPLLPSRRLLRLSLLVFFIAIPFIGKRREKRNLVQQKFMNKFKDAIYGAGKKERREGDGNPWEYEQARQQKFMNFKWHFGR